MTIFVGIDIGLTGAISALDPNGRATVADLPVVESDAGNRIDGRALLNLVREFVPAGAVCTFVIEDVRPRPQGNGNKAGNTMHSQGSLMRSRGNIEAVCDIAGGPVVWVHPQKWKRHFGLIGADKEASRLMAHRMMPGMKPALTRKKDQNRAEALLLAYWGRSTQT